MADVIILRQPETINIHSCTCGVETFLVTENGIMCSSCHVITPFNGISDMLPDTSPSECEPA